MKIKSLIMGAAVAILAVSGAKAADAIVVEAEPVQYVKVCDMYGAGYFYIPGSENCMKLSGEAKVRFTKAKKSGVSTATAKLNIDVATETEHGALRSSAVFAASTTDVLLDKATISLNGFNTGYDKSGFARFASAGLTGLSIGGSQYDAKGNFFEYSNSISDISYIIGAEVNGTNSQKIDGYAGVALNSESFNLAVIGGYDDNAEGFAARVSADYDLGMVALGAWVSVDDKDTKFVNGAGDYDFGGSANFVIDDNSTFAIGYADFDKGSPIVSAGINYNVVDGFAVKPIYSRELEANASTFRVDFVRSF